MDRAEFQAGKSNTALAEVLVFSVVENAGLPGRLFEENKMLCVSSVSRGAPVMECETDSFHAALPE